MTITYDTKGKIFTNIIVKESVAALIQTTLCTIEGEVHVRQGERFKDELDSSESFLAVTNATVKGENQQILFTTRFIAVRRDQVVWAMPLEEVQKEWEAC